MTFFMCWMEWPAFMPDRGSERTSGPATPRIGWPLHQLVGLKQTIDPRRHHRPSHGFTVEFVFIVMAFDKIEKRWHRADAWHNLYGREFDEYVEP